MSAICWQISPHTWTEGKQESTDDVLQKGVLKTAEVQAWRVLQQEGWGSSKRLGWMVFALQVNMLEE